MNAKLSQKDNEFQEGGTAREYGRLMLKIRLPLPLYQSLNQSFKMLISFWIHDRFFGRHYSGQSVPDLCHGSGWAQAGGGLFLRAGGH